MTLNRLTPAEAAQWAEICANHVLEGIMFGCFNDRNMKFPFHRATGDYSQDRFVQYALAWLAYVPMEEPINIGFGKYKATIKANQTVGTGNRTFNADGLLKAPALRCHDKNGQVIDFHLGNYEVKPDKKYKSYLWRKRNFKHKSQDNPLFGYRLASQWEVDFLTGKKTDAFIWPKIASFTATDKKILTHKDYDLKSAQPIPLDFNQYRTLAAQAKKIAALEKKVDTIETTCDQLEEKGDERDKRIETVQKEHKESILVLKAEYDGKLKKQTETYQGKLDELKEEHKNKIDIQQQELTNKLIYLEKTCGIKISNLENENTKLKNKLDVVNKNIDVIKKGNTTLKGTVNELMSRLEKLENNQRVAIPESNNTVNITNPSVIVEENTHQTAAKNEPSIQSPLQMGSMFSNNAPQIKQKDNRQRTCSTFMPNMTDTSHE